MAHENRFGSLIFCSRCGNLLNLPADDDIILCECCQQPADASGQSPHLPPPLLRFRTILDDFLFVLSFLNGDSV